MEVIDARLGRMVKRVAPVALQEDVDVVALCVPPGGGPSLSRKLLEALAALGIRGDGGGRRLPGGDRAVKIAAWIRDSKK